MRDGHRVDGRRANAATPSHEAGRFQPGFTAVCKRCFWLVKGGVGRPDRPTVTGASIRSVQGWCAIWRRSKERRQPQKALAEKPRLGRPSLVPALDRVRLLAELAKDPLALGYAATNWTVPLLAAHLRQRGRLPINAHTLRRRLRAAGLRWKRPRFVFAEPAPHAAQKKGRSSER